MSIVPDRFPVPVVSFTRTVDRALLHRQHASESFLTDATRLGSDAFVAAALLPPAHPHYSAHTGPSRDRDPLLMLECVRQAETYAAHTMFGVEPDAHFVLRNWSAEFAPGIPPVADRPTELMMTALTRNARVVRDRLRGLEYELELWTDGVRLGRVHMEVGYTSHAAYTVLRARRHDGRQPPSSDDLAPTPGRPVDPARVGRLCATDAVLLDVEVAGDSATARLRVPVENRSLFDHAQDHVPAMVLVEAARQLAALATHEWGGAAPDRTELVATSSAFAAYAELTEPIELTATSADGRSVDVAFRQRDAQVARAWMVMAVRSRGRGAPWPGQRW